MKDLKQRTIRSGFARLGSQAVNFALRMIQLMVMARLLDPADFGLVAMVTAVTGFYGLFTAAGLSAATIQKETVSEEQVSTLFWINIAVGFVLAVSCVLSAPALVWFYGEPRLFWMTVAVSTGFIFNAAGVQHFALLQRQLRFVAITAIETFSQLVSTVVGIALAFASYGYWALVATAIVAPAIATACAWIFTSWRPGKFYRGVGVRSMLHFGGTVTLNGVIVYVAYNFEKVLIGRFWGADALGLYGRAYQLINVPTENLNAAIGGVAFSALSRLQSDPARLRSYFLKGYSLANSLTLPTTMFCALFADDVVLVVLGPNWTSAVPIFRLLSPTVLVFGIINPTVWLLWSLGLQGRSLKIALVIAPLVIIAYAIGLPFGPIGVASAYSTAMMLWLVPHVFWSLHGTTISPRDLLSAISKPLFSAIVASAFAFACRFYLADLASPILRVALGGGIMVVTYVSILLLVTGQNSLYRELLKGLWAPTAVDS